jgi:hypothetical protein
MQKENESLNAFSSVQGPGSGGAKCTTILMP